MAVEPCEICEVYINGESCENKRCPVQKMKAENKALKEEIRKLRLEMSYMHNPNTIGDRHEMGCW
jgi:hypothetical protein